MLNSTRGPRSGLAADGQPAIILSCLLFGLTILTWPRVLQRLVSLDWQLGSLQPVAYGAQVLFGFLTAASLVLRQRVSALYLSVFSTPKQLLFALIGVVSSLSISLLLAEGVMRAFDFPLASYFTTPEYKRTAFDPEVGWSYVPNRSFEDRIGRQPQPVETYFDGEGSRVRVPEERHDPAAPTVLFVGCSFTMGLGVRYEETFVGRLGAMPEFPFQAVNLGVEAYGTDQAMLLMKRSFKNFATKAVVYTFIADHVSRNANYDRRLLQRGGRFPGTKPLFALHRDGKLYLKRHPISYDQYNYAHLWALIEFAWGRWGPKPTLDVTQALIQEMKTYVESNGATFLMVAWDWDSASLSRRGEDWPPFRASNLNLIDTAVSAPEDWYRRRIPGDGHPDARAHLRMAQLLLAEFKHLGLIPN